MENNKKLIIGVAVVATLIPIWRSGGRKNLTLWGFLLNHTIWGPPVEYVPKEEYTKQIGSFVLR